MPPGPLTWLIAVAISATTYGAQHKVNGLRVERSLVTGAATFVTPSHGHAIPINSTPSPGKPQPIDFLNQYGQLFGVTDPSKQLLSTGTVTDQLGYSHTSYQQIHNGVPVFSGILRIHQNNAGHIVAANGDFYDIDESLSITPGLSADEAASIAATSIGGGQPFANRTKLVVVDPGWYGDRAIGPRLAFHIVLTNALSGVREAFFVDAQTGRILDRWSMVHAAKERKIFDGQDQTRGHGILVREEWSPPVDDPEDVNLAYDYLGDVYDYYFRAFKRDSVDGFGAALRATVHIDLGCPNAYWHGVQMAFCPGVVTDDILAHEFTHGVTASTAQLINQNQPGQLNESFSDVFGEMVDLFNGDASIAGPPVTPPQWPAHLSGAGLDQPNNRRSDAKTSCSLSPGHVNGVRWLIGEDSEGFGGAVRDMWNPPCFGHPDRVGSPLYPCSQDNLFGVSVGSGVPNHAFAMLTDGKTFNGFKVNGIGPIKAAAVWYRALTVYLTPASDFNDAFAAINQAAADLVGAFPADPLTGMPSTLMFTDADANEVNKALLAVELYLPRPCPDVTCCLPDATCIDLPADECLATGGIAGDQGTSCESTPCEACCFIMFGPAGAEGCQMRPTGLCGEGALGAGSTCETTPCPDRFCCLPDGSCQNMGLRDCRLAGGFALRDGSIETCEPDTCEPFEACCYSTQCSDRLPSNFCVESLGIPLGPGTMCFSTICPEPQACCRPDGACSEELAEVCWRDLAGESQGPGSSCDDVSCPGNACCFGDGSCAETSAADCLDAGGRTQLHGTECSSVSCPFLQACCLDDGCRDIELARCQELNGIPQGSGTSCASISCPLQACCLPYGSCLDVATDDCGGLGGLARGFESDCSSLRCVPEGDLDADGDVDLDDFGGVLSCYSGPDSGHLSISCAPADLDADGDVDFADWGRFQTLINVAGG